VTVRRRTSDVTLTPTTLDELIDLADRARAEMTPASHGFFRLSWSAHAAPAVGRGPAQAALVDKLNTLGDEEYRDLFAVYFTGRDADFRDVWKELEISRQHAPAHRNEADTNYLAEKLDLAASLRDARERLRKAGWR
jgi:hypothetical protein